MFETIHATLLSLDPDVDDPERIDRIRHLDQLEAVIAAARARETAAFVVSQRAKQVARGLPVERVGRGIASQVGLARKMSPYAARRYVAQVEILTSDLPETFAALASGSVSERRALLVARESAWLSAEHRRQVDGEVAPQVSKLGARRLVNSVKKIAYRLDPHGAVARVTIAETERRVTIRPAADGMVWLTQLLPMVAGVGAYATLRAAAMARVGVGDERRSLHQLMADLSLERLTGHTAPDQTPVQVNLIMTDQTLLNYGLGRHQPAHVLGGDVIPADLARRTVLNSATVFLRRLYANPARKLAGMESRARLFTNTQRKLLILRDQTCRMPYCDAPIRHAQQIFASQERNVPEAGTERRWPSEGIKPDRREEGHRRSVLATTGRGGDDIITITPTGHIYRSTEPSLAGLAA